MSAIVAKRRIATALSKSVSQHADNIFIVGDRAVVYSEKQKRCTGAFVVAYADGSMITVKNVNESS